MGMINAVGWLMCWRCTVKDSSVLKLDPERKTRAVQRMFCFCPATADATQNY